jgi:hypothetical protein
LAIFGRKKPADETEPKTDAGPTESATVIQSPEKAARFFSHAKTVQETGNYEYAMALWLDGLRQDPFSMLGLESFFKAAASFLGENAKGPSKDTLRQFGGRGEVDRYLRALLDWGMEPESAVLAVRAAASAAQLKLAEPTYWLGERALVAILREKRPRKDLLVKMISVFSEVGAYDKAVEAGEAACRVDPSDGQLSAQVRNLAAQATMTKGGYDQTGQAGGFRANVRDLEKQRQIEEGERIVKTDETIDRLLKAAQEDYKSRPDDPAAINTFARRLIERGTDQDLALARQVLNKAFEETKQFRFRDIAGEVRLRIAQRNLDKYREAAEANPSDEKAQDNYRRAQAKYAEMEIEEFTAKVEAYPTDNKVKLDLGKRLFHAGKVDEAIPLLQRAQHDASRRVEAMYYLAQAFQRIDYTDEAINTYRNAVDAYKVATDEMGMSLRYGLLTALQTKAQNDRDLAAAEEADKLASTLAIQQFDYRDIRQRRDTLKKLINELKRGDAA